VNEHIEPSASIDELLRYEDEPAPRMKRPPSVGGWIVRTLLIAAAVTAVTVVLLRLFGIAVSVGGVLASVLAVLILRRVTAQVAPPPPPRARTHRGSGTDDGLQKWGERDALRVAVKRWENTLESADGDAARFVRVLPALAELVDERLRQRHGVTRAADPARARALLGDALWTFLARPPQRGVTREQWSTVVGQMEKI
jgi:hypothetical protein